jgi:hypothetical protein
VQETENNGGMKKMSKQVESDTPPKNTGTVKLHILVHDKDGKLVKEKFIDNDMYLDQWGAIIAALFKNLGNGTYAGSTTYSCKNTTGAAVTLGGVASTGNSPFFAAALEGLTNSLLVSIGDSTQAAAHTDYGLVGTNRGTAYPASIAESNPSGNILYVSFSVTITLGGTGYTITEAIVQIIVLDSAGAQKTLAITRDVFTGIPVPANGSITLNYTFQYNTS